MRSVCELNDIEMDIPWKKLTKKKQKIILEGLGPKKIEVTFKNRYGKTRSFNAKFEGIIPWLKICNAESESDRAWEIIEGYMREIPCSKCDGARLNPVSLKAVVDDKSINEIGDL